ncbi:hypothetical protein KC19_VG336100 [Ceratodon purpureus]|uniref:Uncharacterized protein n=1 Tax=Ceratodon purpureus TaxID=3225 RepID=A0A8T0HWS8_CERPU|nr:hypothetical protein KC19_VG336100 [Ceratodon purpureus]
MSSRARKARFWSHRFMRMVSRVLVCVLFMFWSYFGVRSAVSLCAMSCVSLWISTRAREARFWSDCLMWMVFRVLIHFVVSFLLYVESLMLLGCICWHWK